MRGCVVGGSPFDGLLLMRPCISRGEWGGKRRKRKLEEERRGGSRDNKAFICRVTRMQPTHCQSYISKCIKLNTDRTLELQRGKQKYPRKIFIPILPAKMVDDERMWA